jgi:hypothetical protein
MMPKHARRPEARALMHERKIAKWLIVLLRQTSVFRDYHR